MVGEGLMELVPGKARCIRLRGEIPAAEMCKLLLFGVDVRWRGLRI